MSVHHSLKNYIYYIAHLYRQLFHKIQTDPLGEFIRNFWLKMVSNMGITNVMAAEKFETVGSGFATKYFSSLWRANQPSALRKFFTYSHSKVCVWSERMEYNRCTVTVRLMDTTARPHPTEYPYPWLVGRWHPKQPKFPIVYDRIAQVDDKQ